MGRPSIIRQVQNTMKSYLQIGTSKYETKKSGLTTSDKIFSWSTYRSYVKHACYFVEYCRQNHGCRTLDECKQYAAEWMDTRRNLSAYTQKLELAALRKLYQDPFDSIKTDQRRRSNIKRSREVAVRDRGFSIINNADLITFCRCTGLRRSELAALSVYDITINPDGTGHVYVRSGKGGKSRIAPLAVQDGEIDAMRRCIDKSSGYRLFDHIPGKMDVHSYRSEYCRRIYKKYARPLEQLTRKQKYYCRNDQRGCVYDRSAMMAASRSLGHNRINVIASHYLGSISAD